MGDERGESDFHLVQSRGDRKKEGQVHPRGRGAGNRGRGRGDRRGNDERPRREHKPREAKDATPEAAAE